LSINRKTISYLLFFFLSYFLFLLLWLQVKDNYAKSISYAASHITSVLKDVEFKFIIEDKKKATMQAVFSVFRENKGLKLLSAGFIDTSVYTFNSPLTFAIIAVFLLATKNKKQLYFNALLLLLLLHLFSVVILQTKGISEFFVQEGFEEANLINRALLPFLAEYFFEVLRFFEPFLVGAYIFLRTDESA